MIFSRSEGCASQDGGPERPVLIDSYLRDATEVDVDALADGSDVFVAGGREQALSPE